MSKATEFDILLFGDDTFDLDFIDDAFNIEIADDTSPVETIDIDILLYDEDTFGLELIDDSFDIELIDRGATSPADYNKLMNKPIINGDTDEGDLTFADLGITIISDQQIIDIVDDAYNQIFNT